MHDWFTNYSLTLLCATHTHTYTYIHTHTHTHISQGLRKGLEPLFEQFKVNVYFGAHVHHYERTLPVVNNGVVAGTLEAPKGIVHILSGVRCVFVCFKKITRYILTLV